MRRDRDGELLLIEDEPAHSCDRGFVDATADPLIPCPVCKSDLLTRLRKQRTETRR